MIYSIIVQVIGFFAVICFIISYQIKSNKALYLLQMTGSGLFCVQFLLLGATSGCFNLILIVVRNLMLSLSHKYKWLAWKGWILIIVAVSILILVLTWQGPLSLLPSVALIGSTIGYWTGNAQKIRLCNLICASPAWLVYDIFVGSIGGVINEAIMLVSISVSIYRYGWKNMGDPEFGNKKID